MVAGARPDVLAAAISREDFLRRGNKARELCVLYRRRTLAGIVLLIVGIGCALIKGYMEMESSIIVSAVGVYHVWVFGRMLLMEMHIERRFTVAGEKLRRSSIVSIQEMEGN